jgi:RNA polymerase sigma-70 factor (ECF subfamily)
MSELSAIYSNEFILLKESITAYLYRLTANKEDAEDIVQETYLKVAEKIDSFQQRSSFKTWVFTIATNLAKDNRRAKNRWKIEAQDACKAAARVNTKYQEQMNSAFEEQTEKKFELTEHINYCFTCIAKNLTLEKQIAIVLKEFYDFKRAEIAEILNVSEGVVKHLLFDGRKELQEKYQQRCSLINKGGTCYQCAELSNYFEQNNQAEEKIAQLELKSANTPEINLDLRFQLINRINPLTGNGAKLEDTILQILRETIQDS